MTNPQPTTVRTAKRGYEIVRDPLLNKGTAFTEQERDALGLHGLLPAQVNDITEQERRVMRSLDTLTSPIEKYVRLTTLQNVLLPLMIAEGTFRYFRHRAEHHRQATELLTQFGLGHRLRHLPRELSGGEMQRAAIARALIIHPDVLLADEPTGNLDQSTGHEIMKILRSLNAEADLTIVMVTHDQTLAADGDRIVRIAEGVVQPL